MGAASAAEAYDIKPLKAPVLAGAPLKIFTALVGNRGPLGGLVTRHLVSKNGFTRLCKDPVAGVEAAAGRGEDLLAAAEDAPPLPAASGAEAEAGASAALPGGREALALATSADFVAAYESGEATPSGVVEKALAAIAQQGGAVKRLNCVVQCHPDEVREAGAAATARYAAQAQLSPLDGVPIVVKDEVDVKGYVTSGGLVRVLREGKPCEADCAAVAGLRAAGAIILGKSFMTEMGLGPSHGWCRAFGGQCYNPYGFPHYEPGGSSAGSGVAVAAGLVPIAVGCDGGGSIRIPAARNGVCGIKPTFEYLPCGSEGWNICPTVCHIGPLAATAEDAYLALHYMRAGHGALPSPPPPLAVPAVHGLKIGVFWPFFEDADADVVALCRAQLDALVARGAVLVPLVIEQLDRCLKAHAAIILHEGYDGEMKRFGEAEWRKMISNELGIDTKLKELINERMRLLKSKDGVPLYETAQKVRRHFTAELLRTLEDVDVLATPAMPQPPSRVAGGDPMTQKLDAATDGQAMKYHVIGNMTGLPGVVAPAGYVERKNKKTKRKDVLPVGLQLMGKARSDTALLQLAALLERLAPAWEAPSLMAPRLL